MRCTRSRLLLRYNCANIFLATNWRIVWLSFHWKCTYTWRAGATNHDLPFYWFEILYFNLDNFIENQLFILVLMMRFYFDFFLFFLVFCLCQIGFDVFYDIHVRFITAISFYCFSYNSYFYVFIGIFRYVTFIFMVYMVFDHAFARLKNCLFAIIGMTNIVIHSEYMICGPLKI